MHKLFVIFIFLFAGMHAQAQDVYDTTVTTTVIEAPAEEYEDEDYNRYVEKDTFLFTRNISISEDSIISWRSRKEYAYIHNIDSLLKAYQQEPVPVSKVPKTGSFMNRLLSGSLIKGIMWILAILFVAVILYQLLKSNGLFQRKYASNVSAVPEENEELLLQNDFDGLVQQALIQGDYRMAVRYLFLKTLQQLRDKEHISYEPDKTNSRYINELPVNWRNDFSRLILQYEYVWYGYFDINKEQYDTIQKGFGSFFQKV